jgi:hypothetical protein
LLALREIKPLLRHMHASAAGLASSAVVAAIALHASVLLHLNLCLYLSANTRSSSNTSSFMKRWHSPTLSGKWWRWWWN